MSNLCFDYLFIELSEVLYSLHATVDIGVRQSNSFSMSKRCLQSPPLRGFTPYHPHLWRATCSPPQLHKYLHCKKQQQQQQKNNKKTHAVTLPLTISSKNCRKGS